MENLTDEQVSNWKDDIVDVLIQLYSNLNDVANTCQMISLKVGSRDPSLSQSWIHLSDVTSDAVKKLTTKKDIFDDTLTTFVNTVIAINEKMISTVQLAENEFTDFYNRIAAIY